LLVLRNMRTPFLAALLALSLPACIAGEITDVGDNQGGGDQGGGGDGTGGGDGSGSGSQNTPRVVATVDKDAITTELGKAETVTVTLRSEEGFAGDVTVAARLVDPGDVAMPNLTMQAPANVVLAANATTTATFQIQVPMNATGADLTGELKIDLMSDVGTQSLSTTVNVKAIYTVDYALNTGNAVANHMNAGVQNLVVKRGAILRFHNSDTITHRIHGDGAFPHEAGVGASGRNYDVATTALAPGSGGNLGCHDHGNSTYSRYVVE
jgi:hypothetical protein